MMGFGLIISALFIGGVVVAALGVGNIFLKNNNPVHGIFGGQSTRSPQDILAERYARGEITREELETMRSDIEKLG